MPSYVMETEDVKKALEFLILQKTKGTGKLASEIKRLTSSRTKINGDIRIPTGMFWSIQEKVPTAVFQTKNE